MPRPVAMPNDPVKPVHQANSSCPRALPEGYLWRVWVALFLLIGGLAWMVLFDSALGLLMVLSGIAFSKLSGLQRMVKTIQQGADEDW